MPDIAAPTRVDDARRASSGARTFGSVSTLRCRFQCRIIPLWLNVNETKTPTM